ncbi:hypothetical protein ONZ45_g388 [Pleurotus djamor]|nr:hypothetical protein ONZ45_g388 [Pleurotus djamor]
MPFRTIPIVDELNPLYCPEISSDAYLNVLRRRYEEDADTFYFSRQEERLQLSKAFAKVLLQTVDDSVGKKLMDDVWDFDEDSTLTVGDSPNLLNASRLDQPVKRKRPRDSLEATFTDLQGPSKYARSCPSVHDSSFEVGLTRDTLHYSKIVSSPLSDVKPSSPTTVIDALKARILVLEDSLHGPILGSETPRGIKSLIERLNTLLPGTRLKERLCDLSELSHQSIVDFLGRNGLLNPRVLDVFPLENGLNVDCYDALQIFGKPNSYLFLAELSISGTPLRDSDIMHIHHLPRLTSLFLEETTIGNEAVFLLTSLKRSLAFLSVSYNPAINDDAVPAILVLAKLEYLSILGTGVKMPGLRKLASAALADRRPLRLDCPASCEKYISRLHTQYLVNPAPPLIVGPELCGQLSVAALKRNLSAHSEANPTIFAGGNKQEMVIRLRELLDRRRSDILVRDLVFGVNEEETVEVDEEDMEKII